MQGANASFTWAWSDSNAPAGAEEPGGAFDVAGGGRRRILVTESPGKGVVITPGTKDYMLWTLRVRTALSTQSRAHVYRRTPSSPQLQTCTAPSSTRIDSKSQPQNQHFWSCPTFWVLSCPVRCSSLYRFCWLQVGYQMFKAYNIVMKEAKAVLKSMCHLYEVQ